MNKTLSIGLAGYSFIIDENAYNTLSEYLSALKTTLDTSEAEEVMQDIEIRIVEIFKESLGKREIISQEDVEKVIALIGKPEEIDNLEDVSATPKEEKQYPPTEKRQLFRDTSAQKIAGVCAGLAHYAGIDVTLMRMIWIAVVVLGLFTAAISSTLIIILYIILWVILPQAKNTSDFLKMKGMPINFDTLKSANETPIKNQTPISENGFWNFVRYTLGGIFLIMTLSCVLGIFTLFMFWGNYSSGNLHFNVAELDFLFGKESTWLAKTIIALGTLIPALLFGIISIKLFSPKTKIKNVGYVLGGLFVLLLGLSIYLGTSMAKEAMIYKGEKEETENIAINTSRDTLYIDMHNITIPKEYTPYDDRLFSDRKTVFKKDKPALKITPKEEVKTPYLIITKEAEGYNIPFEISVPVKVVDNKILLPNFIKYPYEHRLRDYNVRYELVIPKTTQVFSLSKEIQLDRKSEYTEDSEYDSYNDNYEYDDNHFQSIQNLNINGKSMQIERNSKFGDSIKINGKLYEKEIGEEMIKIFSK